MKSFFRIIFKTVLLLIVLVGCATTEEIQETNPIALLNQCKVYAKKDQHDRAIAYFNKAIEIYPGFAETHLNRAFAYYEKEEFDKAISDYTKAIEINPRDTRIYNFRALAYRAYA
jgi:tetratricopeptide (TPR) repeat protein